MKDWSVVVAGTGFAIVGTLAGFVIGQHLGRKDLFNQLERCEASAAAVAEESWVTDEQLAEWGLARGPDPALSKPWVYDPSKYHPLRSDAISAEDIANASNVEGIATDKPE